MSRIDYSKWDHFDSSSSDNEDCDIFDGDPEALRSLYNTAARHESEFVKIHPRDDVSTLHPVFLSDPNNFIPRCCPYIGKFDNWGIAIEDDDGVPGVMRSMQRRISTQSLYGRGADPAFQKTPEKQFVEKLILKKEKQLEDSPKEFLERDFVLRISMDEIWPEIWRKFKVSGGVNLHILQDKIISPIMGWTRNYHAYCFTDRSDGAVFGPLQCDAVDMCWIDNHGYEFMDDKKVQLGLVLRKAGDELGYLYDMGDQWRHTIVVEKILSKKESTGSCVLMDGAMRCPPEDSNGCEGKGNHSYNEFVHKLPKKKKWKGPMEHSLSKTLREKLMEASGSMNCRPNMFDPYEFNLKKIQSELRQALSGKASSRIGSKKMIFPMVPGAQDLFDEKPGPGRQVVREHEWPCGHGPYMEETLNLMRDSKTDSLCSNCGKPNDLQCCSACRMVRYCGRACQRTHWIACHKQECKKLASQRKQVKAEIKAKHKQTKSDGTRPE